MVQPTNAPQPYRTGHDGRSLLDPDARFLLANERTLLSWTRTALAVIAGGIALAQLGYRTPGEVVFGVVAILFGAFMATIGYLRFQAADQAIRAGRLPTIGRSPRYQAFGVVLLALIVAVIEISHLRG